jgi:hypothetical protein
MHQLTLYFSRLNVSGGKVQVNIPANSAAVIYTNAKL